MNRLHHVKQTLIRNIKDNNSYGNVEFVLLDYNSGDGLEQWAKDNLLSYINQGMLRYFKTNQPAFFNHSHAKNMALKLSAGDIVCSINADHYLGKGFAGYVNQVFQESVYSVITPIPKAYNLRRTTDPPSGSWGRVCMLRSSFDNIGGYDETMKKYGNDDIDLINRLQMIGIEKKWLRQQRFNKTISHDNDERYSSLKKLNDVEKIFIKPIRPDRSEIIYMFKTRVYERFILIDNANIASDNWKSSLKRGTHQYSHDISEFDWQEGHWWSDNNQYQLYGSEGLHLSIPLAAESGKQVYYEVKNEENIYNLSILNYTQYNLNKMRKQLHEKRFKVNPDGYGQGRVSCNFDENKVVSIN